MGWQRYGRIGRAAPLIAVVAFLLRLWAFWVHQQHVPHYILSSMPWMYEPGAIARSLALGQGFSNPFRIGGPTGPTAWFAPVYPLLAAGALKIFGVDSYAAYTACVMLNAVASALVCLPLYAVGRRIAGVGVACASAWVWAIFPNAIIVSYEWIWDTSISALLGIALLWATLKLSPPSGAAAPRLRGWVAYGLLWGAAVMTNPTLLSLLPFLLGWLVWRTRSGRRAVVALAVMCACCVPWTVRNFLVFHSFVPLRSVMGLELWLGNNDQNVTEFPGWLHPVEDKAERQQYVRMGEIAYMHAKERLAIRWMFAHPGRVAKTSISRAVAFWAGLPNPIGAFRTTTSAFARLLILSNCLLGIGAFAGCFVLWRQHSPFVVPLAAYPVVFPAVYYLTQALLRYRIPIDPVVILLSVLSVAALARACGKRLGKSTDGRIAARAR